MKKKILSLLLTLSMVLSFFPGMSHTASAAEEDGDTYIPLEVSGFNKDVVVEKEHVITPGSEISDDIATPFDGENKGAYYALYEEGTNREEGLPSSRDIGEGKFTLQPYDQNNVLQLYGEETDDTAQGSLEFVNQTGYPMIAFLGAGGNGDTPFEAKITYTDGTTSETLTAEAPDWYLGTYDGFKRGPFGRVKITTDDQKNAGTMECEGGPNLYAFTIKTDRTKAIKSIDFVYTGGETKRLNIMAVSGVIPKGTHTINFKSNGGGIGIMVNLGGYVGEYTLPDNGYTPKTGYRFLGWSTDKEGTTLLQPGVDKIDVQDDVTLYAQWDAPENAGPEIIEDLGKSIISVANDNTVSVNASASDGYFYYMTTKPLSDFANSIMDEDDYIQLIMDGVDQSIVDMSMESIFSFTSAGVANILRYGSGTGTGQVFAVGGDSAEGISEVTSKHLFEDSIVVVYKLHADKKISNDYTGATENPIASGSEYAHAYAIYGVYAGIADVPDHKHCVYGCGDEECEEQEHGGVVNWIGISSLDQIKETGGYYYLTEDVVIALPNYEWEWVPPAGTVLCLNGHVVKHSSYDNSIAVKNGNFTLTDCQTKEHKFTVEDNGLWVLADAGVEPTSTDTAVTKTVNGGVITGGYFGVYVGESGNFTMYGGNLVGNHSRNGGGGIKVEDGTATICGGTICGNHSSYQRGGGIYAEDATLNVFGGTITENVADYVGGGGIYFWNTTLNVKGAPVIDNNWFNGVENNVWFEIASYSELLEPTNAIPTFRIVAPLTEGAAIGVTLTTSDFFTRGWGEAVEEMKDKDPNHYFFSDNEAYAIVAENGELRLGDPVRIEYADGTVETWDGESDRTIKANAKVYFIANFTQKGALTITNSAKVAIYGSEGVKVNVTEVDAAYVIEGNAQVMMSGLDITRAIESSKYNLFVISDAQLTCEDIVILEDTRGVFEINTNGVLIMDVDEETGESKTKIVSERDGSTGRPIFDNIDGIVYIKAGKFTRNGTSGQIVGNGTNAKVFIEGGTLINPKGTSDTVANGKITMTGGVIESPKSAAIRSGKDTDKIVITGGTIRNSKHGVQVGRSTTSGDVAGGSVTIGGTVAFENNTYDVYLWTKTSVFTFGTETDENAENGVAVYTGKPFSVKSKVALGTNEHRRITTNGTDMSMRDYVYAAVEGQAVSFSSGSGDEVDYLYLWAHTHVYDTSGLGKEEYLVSPATCSAFAVYRKYCGVDGCGNGSDDPNDYEIDTTSLTDHSYEYQNYDEVNDTHGHKCSACGSVSSKVYKTKVVWDETGHWRVCASDSCGLTTTKAAHVYTYAPDSDNAGKHIGTCECGHITNENCTYGDDEVCDKCKYDSHKHEYKYSSNGDGTHTHACECGDVAIENEACSYGDDEICDKCRSKKTYIITLNLEGLEGGYAEIIFNPKDPLIDGGEYYLYGESGSVGSEVLKANTDSAAVTVGADYPYAFKNLVVTVNGGEPIVGTFDDCYGHVFYIDGFTEDSVITVIGVATEREFESFDSTLLQSETFDAIVDGDPLPDLGEAIESAWITLVGGSRLFRSHSWYLSAKWLCAPIGSDETPYEVNHAAADTSECDYFVQITFPVIGTVFEVDEDAMTSDSIHIINEQGAAYDVVSFGFQGLEGTDNRDLFVAVVKPHEHSYTYTSNGDGTHNGACECGKDAIVNEKCAYGEDEICDKCKYDSHKHSYTYTSNGDGTHNGACACGKDAIANENCVYGEDEVCDKCKYDSHKHSYTYTSNGDGTHNGACACGKDAIVNEKCAYGEDEICDKCKYDSHKHSYTYTSNGDGTHNGACACGKDAIANETCTYEDGVCVKCGYVTYEVTVTVREEIAIDEYVDCDNAEVTLIGLNGDEQFKNQSAGNGLYIFENVSVGVYNLVIQKGDKMKTILVTIGTENVDLGVVILPVMEIKSEVNVSVDVGDDSPVEGALVGGLDNLAEDIADEIDTEDGVSVSVEVSMQINAQMSDDVDPEHKGSIEEEAATQSENLTFLDITIDKTITTKKTGEDEVKTTDPIHDTVSLLEILIPFDTDGRYDFAVYRYHEDHSDGDVQKLTTYKNSDGEYLKIEDGVIKMYVRYFSTYAIGYSTGTEPTEYTVSFEANGGTGTMAAVTVEANTEYTLPACGFTAPEGKKFKAWAINGVEYAAGDKITVAANVEIKAIWEYVYYTVTYSDGGNWISTERVKHGDTLELSECMFTAPKGKMFKAWEIDGVEYAVGEEIIITENVTVTAIWRNTSESPDVSYDVTVEEVDGGTIRVMPAEAVAGSTVTVIVTPDEGSELKELVIRDATGKTIEWTPAGENEYTFVMPDSEVTISVVFHTIGEDCPKDATCPIWPFLDAKTTAWYHDGVHYCIENGLMNGLAVDRFDPDGTTTRAQIVTILWRLEGKPVVNYAMSFGDVAADQWYTEAVRWAAAEGIVLGYSDAEFAPNVAITREQMVAILWRYCQYKGIDVSVGEDTNILSYTDAFDVHTWAMDAMQWACGAGVVSGVADGNGMKLDPTGTATRAQVATMLWRFCEEIIKP